MKHTLSSHRGKRPPSIALYALYMAAFCLCVMPHIAHAAVNTPLGNVLCTTVGWMTGNLGVGLEIACLTILGITAMLGKVSWSMAIIEACAIAALFSAAEIVMALNAGATGGCATA